MTSPATFYIVRHGESEANVLGLFGSTVETGLTEKGRVQARELAKAFSSKVTFDLVFASDLLRARQTAEILVAEKELAVITSKAIRERSYGRLNGKTEQQIREELGELYVKYEAASDKEKFSAKLVEDMESAEEALQRILRFIREIAVAYSGKTILVISHNTLMRTLLIHLGFADHHEIDRKCIANTAYLKVKCDGADMVLKETFGITKKQS